MHNDRELPKSTWWKCNHPKCKRTKEFSVPWGQPARCPDCELFNVSMVAAPAAASAPHDPPGGPQFVSAPSAAAAGASSASAGACKRAGQAHVCNIQCTGLAPVPAPRPKSAAAAALAPVNYWYDSKPIVNALKKNDFAQLKHLLFNSPLSSVYIFGQCETLPVLRLLLADTKYPGDDIQWARSWCSRDSLDKGIDIVDILAVDLWTTVCKFFRYENDLGDYSKSVANLNNFHSVWDLWQRLSVDESVYSSPKHKELAEKILNKYKLISDLLVRIGVNNKKLLLKHSTDNKEHTGLTAGVLEYCSHEDSFFASDSICAVRFVVYTIRAVVKHIETTFPRIQQMELALRPSLVNDVLALCQQYVATLPMQFVQPLLINNKFVHGLYSDPRFIPPLHVKNCMGCRAQFGDSDLWSVLNPDRKTNRYNCALCGKVVCYDCYTSYGELQGEKFDSCKSCYNLNYREAKPYTAQVKPNPLNAYMN